MVKHCLGKKELARNTEESRVEVHRPAGLSLEKRAGEKLLLIIVLKRLVFRRLSQETQPYSLNLN